MNFAEARSEAVQGAWIRHDGMAEGSYISYNFAGLRINFPHSSSGWTPTDADLAADWTICGPMEAPKPRPDPWRNKKGYCNNCGHLLCECDPPKPQRDKWGRAL